MSVTTNNDDMKPIGVNSLSDYAPNKLHLLLKTPISIDIAISREIPSKNIDNSSDLSKQPSNKNKTASKRINFARYIIPITRIRASSVHYEQNKPSQQPTTPVKRLDNCDMRFFIIRHGERVDRYFGPNWYLLAFDQQDQYRPFHRNLPPQLPTRSNKYFWAIDTPLTLFGLSTAKKLGRILASKHFQPKYAYSSPAMRCILTTIQILKGLDLENKIPIRIEPGLLELGASRFGMNVFFKPIDWHKYGINIDLSYQPIVTHVPPVEHENTYYLRSKHVIREIEKLHSNSSLESLNILIVAHATSPETLTWDLVGKQPNVNDLYRLSLNIAYLQMVISERKQENKFWSLKPVRWV